jgi:crossover junction endodeoxyribonuclease RuvC
MKELDEKLVAIYTRIVELIQTYHPETASIEKIFHSVNPRSSLLLGHARGVSMLAAKMAKLEVVEYSPNQVKSAVTGVGRASKEQVKSMVRILLNMDRTKLIKEDESDALAIAICHANTMDFSTNNSGERR